MKQRNNGQYDKFSGPDCTDNFLIIKEKFNYEGLDWFSVEQAFQSLKFLKDSRTRTEIHSAGPRPRENSISYGERVWLLGQGSIRREDWELEKIKVMLLLNIAKYAANKSFQHDLVATQNYRIIAKESTWKWTYWNAAIQTYVRQLIHDGKNLVHCLKEISEVHSKEVEEMIKKVTNLMQNLNFIAIIVPRTIFQLWNCTREVLPLKESLKYHKIPKSPCGQGNLFCAVLLISNRHSIKMNLMLL